MDKTQEKINACLAGMADVMQENGPNFYPQMNRLMRRLRWLVFWQRLRWLFCGGPLP